MITVQNLHSNSVIVDLTDLAGGTNLIELGAFQSVQSPAVRVDGEVLSETLISRPSVIYYTGTNGPSCWVGDDYPETVYAFEGGVLALTILGITACLRLVKRGITVSRASYD